MRRKPPKHCKQCGEILENRESKFCCKECFNSNRRDAVVAKWMEDPSSVNTKHGISYTIAIYLKEQAGWKCQSPNCCVPGGWGEVHPATGRVPIELDHIDGDAYNNHPDNLIVLCPNCHSLTMNYRALNKQGTRIHRK